MAKKTYIKAITEGIDIALAEDPKTLVFGEDVGKNGGVFRATNGLQESTARIGSSVPHLLNLVS
jgi:Pyruvate/2-oxoglutarate dehydrogenase complex, dehydrogenase (E1) component, eukaryotic type, beta subunit